MERGRILSYLGQNWLNVCSLMRGAVGSDVGLLQSVNDDILNNSGKQLRPILSLLMAKACGNVNADSEYVAAVSEILHNATLIHDDVADLSLRRRGAPTLYSTIGANSAVLVGDFWLARAMELMTRAERSSRVSRLFSKTLTDLAEGEMLQLEKSRSLDTTEDDYLRIIYCKTASLFVAAIVSAAISVDAPPEYMAAAERYAEASGIAFQIKDDILDYSGDDKLGKPVGLDLVEKKITLPLLGALKNCGEDCGIRELVGTAAEHPENCEKIRRFVETYGGIGYAASRLDEYIDRAESALADLPGSPARDMLSELVRFNAFRVE